VITPGKGILGRVAGAATGRVVEYVDPDVILEYVDLDQLIERIDVQRIIDRIDPNVLMDRIDIQRLLSRVDLNEVLAGVDLDLLLARVDLEAVVQRSGVPDIIMASTGRFADSAVDLGRRQVVGVDALVDRGVDRLLRRPADQAAAPENLRDDTRSTDGSRTSVTGHYAGPLGRALAAVVDIAVITASFAVGYFVTDLLTTTFFGRPLSGDRSQPLAVVALGLWAFLYVYAGLAVAGRTFGKAAVGLRVVRADGSPITARQAFVRTLVFPLSVAFAGIGLLMIVLQREHRALHDLIAGTAVVTDWGDRTAELPGPLSAFLARSGVS
jgi:uncharacterized RDD family membrane protein YckC